MKIVFYKNDKDEYKNKVLKKLVEVKYCNLLSNQEAQNLILIWIYNKKILIFILKLKL